MPVNRRRVNLWTDHKPLEITAQKPLASALKRLQRLLMRLMQYVVELKLQASFGDAPCWYTLESIPNSQTPTPGKADEEVERIYSVT